MAVANRPGANRPAADPPGQGNDRQFVTALARGRLVLRCFRSGEELLGNHQLAERCGLPEMVLRAARPAAAGAVPHVTSLLPSAGNQPPNRRLSQAPIRASRPCGAGAASTSGTTTV